MNMIIEVLPLLVFTTFAGTAAGVYAVDACMGNAGLRAGREMCGPAWLFPLTCLALLGIGLCGTLAHLGQPLRFVNGLSNPASGISQEAYWSIALGLVIAADCAHAKFRGSSPRPLRWAGGVAGAGLMVVTGLAYFDCLGIPAWSSAATVPLFVLGDVALGAALCALFYRGGFSNGIVTAVNVAAQVVWLVAVVAFGLHLARAGLQATGLLVAAGITGPLGVSACVVLARAGKVSRNVATACVAALVFASVVLARYAFFAAGIG